MPDETRKLKDELAKALAGAQSIHRTAREENRARTSEEVESIDKALADAEALRSRIADAEQAERVDAELATLNERQAEMAERDAAVIAEQRRGFAVKPSDRKVGWRAEMRNALRSSSAKAFGSDEIAIVRPDSDAGERTNVLAANEGEVRAISTAAGSAQATIPTPFANMLYWERDTASTFRATMPTVIPTSNGQPYEWPILTSATTAAAAGEASNLSTVANATPIFGKITLGAYKYARSVPMSSEVIADTGVPLEQFVTRDLGRAIARVQDVVFWTGDGTTEPQGVTSGGFTNVVTDVSKAAGGAIEYGHIVTALSSLDQSYGNLGSYVPQEMDGPPPELCWAMHPSTLRSVWLIQDGDGRYLFNPMIVARQGAVLFGYKIVTSTHLAQLGGASRTVIYFGSFGDAFLLREAGPMVLRWSDESRFGTDEREYRVTSRVDLKVRDSEAIVGIRTAD